MTNGSKENVTISYMASTFVNLCAYADWSTQLASKKDITETIPMQKDAIGSEVKTSDVVVGASRGLDLNYNIHIHLPATRDQAVYDALFASLAKHIPLK